MARVLFNFVRSDFTPATGSNARIRVAPLISPLVTGSIYTGDVLTSSLDAAGSVTLNLVPNLYRVEYGGEGHTTFYINVTGSTGITASNIVVSQSVLPASSASVQFDLLYTDATDFSGRAIHIAPMSPPIVCGALLGVGDRLTKSTDAHGDLTSSLLPGYYRVTAIGRTAETTFHIVVPTGSATYNASQLYVPTASAGLTVRFPTVPYTVYTRGQVDALLSGSGGSSSVSASYARTSSILIVPVRSGILTTGSNTQNVDNEWGIANPAGSGIQLGNGLVIYFDGTGIFNNDLQVTGSVTAFSGLTGSLLGTASNAASASFVRSSSFAVSASSALTSSTLSSTLPVSKGGTGATAFNSGYLLLGGGSGPIVTHPSLVWDNGTSTLISAVTYAWGSTGGSNFPGGRLTTDSGVCPVEQFWGQGNQNPIVRREYYDHDMGGGLLGYDQVYETGGTMTWEWWNGTPTQMMHLDDGGNLTIVGKLTAANIDPDWVLYDMRTRAQISASVTGSVPKEKQSGAVLFFNSGSRRLEYFIASENKFYNLDGTEIP